MSTIIAVAVTLLISVAIMTWMDFRYKRETEELAADFSQRIQDYQRKLTILCTQPETEEAAEICLHIRLNLAAERMIEKTEGNESINLN